MFGPAWSQARAAIRCVMRHEERAACAICRTADQPYCTTTETIVTRYAPVPPPPNLLSALSTWKAAALPRRLGGVLVGCLVLLALASASPLSASAAPTLPANFVDQSVANLPRAISRAWFALLVFNLCASVAVVLAFSFAVGSLAFWAPRAAEEISTPLIRMFFHLKQFPFDGLSPLVLGLVTLIPIGFMAWYPSRYLLGLDPAPLASIATPLVALAVIGLARLAFAKGMQHYARTGSQRYHALGHRS